MLMVYEITDAASREAVESRIKGNADTAAMEQQLAEKAEATRVIVEAVRERGDAAVAEFTERFDGVALKPEEFEVKPEEIEAALNSVDPDLLRIIRKAHANIQTYHSKHLRQSWEETAEDGTVLGQRITAIESAGVYVPGGKAFYPSSVLMNIVPARVAGVEEIVMVSPPSYNGTIHPVVLAAAHIAGASRVFRLGGAQSVAALAYGTETVPSVLKITGPGNTFVTVAKRLVRTICDIDTEAGPSEVVVIADEKSDPRHSAAEMLAQAEHDEEASCILFTPSKTLAEQVEQALQEQMARLPRGEIMGKALSASGVVVITRDLDEAAELASLAAGEHLAILTEDPRGTLDKVPNAGAAMLGPYTSVAMGDYFAGPNHILPTNRRARFASPLTAEDFRKVTSIIQYSRARFDADAEDIMRFATAEELTAHANAVEVRK